MLAILLGFAHGFADIQVLLCCPSFRSAAPSDCPPFNWRASLMVRSDEGKTLADQVGSIRLSDSAAIAIGRLIVEMWLSGARRQVCRRSAAPLLSPNSPAVLMRAVPRSIVSAATPS
jgi:hypothetical protein